MLKLRKRGDVWYVRGTVSGVRVYESTRTPDEEQAKRYLAKRQNELYNQAQFGHKGSHTFGEAVDTYLDGKGSLGHTATNVLLKLMDAFQDVPLGSIDQSALDRYIRRHYPKAAPATTIRAVITPITAVMNSATKRGWCDAPRFDRPKVKPHRARFLTYDEADALVAASARHLQPILTFLLNTGCRISEALTLKWYAVDLDRKLVVFGKTDDDKTKNDETRGVPLNEIAFATLVTMSCRGGSVFRTHKGEPYPVREGGGQIKTGFRNACRRSGIGHVRVHDLRHTFASWLSMAGQTEATIAELLGHKSRSASITGRYTHLNREHLRAAVESIVEGQNRTKLVQHEIV
ncbi:MAG: tyrosine-type recombinase/integrase, partial [Geminicoccaceae bacterium]